MDLADHLVVLLQGPPLRKVNQCHARSLSLGAVTGNTAAVGPPRRPFGEAQRAGPRQPVRGPDPGVPYDSIPRVDAVPTVGRGAVMRRYMIVANQTLGGDELLEVVR